jgi:hypothetical protein
MAHGLGTYGVATWLDGTQGDPVGITADAAGLGGAEAAALGENASGGVGLALGAFGKATGFGAAAYSGYTCYRSVT